MTIFAVQERYRPGDGPLYRLDARVKIVVVFLFALAVTAVPAGNWIALAGFALFVVIAIALSGLPPLAVLRRSMLALPFVAVAAPLLFTRPGETLFTVPLVEWTASSEGAVAVATLMARAWLAVLMSVVLTFVTKPLDLIHALEHLRLPRIMVAIVLFMYRYLFVIGEEGHRLMRARDARSAFAPPQRPPGIPWRAGVLGNMVGSLFIRSYERSERIYAAMQARGYDGTLRVIHHRTLSRWDWLSLVLAAILLMGLALYARV